MGLQVQHGCMWLLLAICIISVVRHEDGVGVHGLGCNWGTRSTHPLPAEIVVRLLKDNGFNKVKLFEAEPEPLKALANSGIEVMLAIPNDLLASLASNINAAIAWVNQNVSTYVSYGVNIRYVAVGNEPFLKSYKDKFVNSTFPALQNIQSALTSSGLSSQVKVTTPLNADVYQSTTGVPSGGDFRPDIHSQIISIISFLHKWSSPLSINIYPFLSLDADPNFPKDFAFFDSNHSSSPVLDGPITYTNVLDANFDTLVSALSKNGFPDMPVIIGEVGWPTDGSSNANPANARRFNQGLVDRILRKQGSPKRPNSPPDIYVFALVDEDAKSVDPGNFERHWGIFNYDGSLKYPLMNNKMMVGARGVRYLGKRWCIVSPSASGLDPVRLGEGVRKACGVGDCTCLSVGSSCGGILDAKANASYAFNAYYQTMNQSEDACSFAGIPTVITTADPSPPQSRCKFNIMIDVTWKNNPNRTRTVPRRPPTTTTTTTTTSTSFAAPMNHNLWILPLHSSAFLYAFILSLLFSF